MAKAAKTVMFDYIASNDKLYSEVGTADPARCLTAVRALKRKLATLETFAEEFNEAMGSDNYGNGLKALKAATFGQVGSVSLPPELSRVPQIWLEGRTKEGKDHGFARYGYYEANREYKRLRPYLEEVWVAIGTEEEDIQQRLKSEILSEYEKLSPEEMGRFCIAFVNDYDLEDIIEDTESKLNQLTKIRYLASFTRQWKPQLSHQKITECNTKRTAKVNPTAPDLGAIFNVFQVKFPQIPPPSTPTHLFGCDFSLRSVTRCRLTL